MYISINISNNLGVVNSQKVHKYGGKMQKTSLMSDSFFVSINNPNLLNEEVWVWKIKGSSLVIVTKNGVKIMSLNGCKTVEFSFDGVDNAFGAIKP
jgi:hypothetical protein